MRPWVVGGLVAVGAFVAIVLGSYAYKGYASTQAPKPPCPAGWAPTHDDRACVPEEQACNSHMNGAFDQSLHCPALSPDGSGWLRINVQGNGGVAVSVKDGRGNVVYSRSVAFTEGLLPDISVKGATGTWTLTTDYHAQGNALIILWG